MKNAVVFFVLSLCALAASAQDITTVAGTGSAIYSGDSGLAINASIGLPGGIAFDKFGNYFFVEFNNTVRKVSYSGTITTIAGNGIAGYSGDNIPATDAQFNGPSYIALDTSGNIYITDYYNNRIRKIDITTGVITTIAGNGMGAYGLDNVAATATSIYGPQGITFDANNNLYFADYENHRIRKIDNSGIITTIAGNGTAASIGDGDAAVLAEVHANGGISSDLQNHIYFADNYKVREIDLLSGIINTLAGTDVYGDCNDHALADTSKFGVLYGITSNVSGGVYVSDMENNRIRLIVGGYVYNIVGNGTAGFEGDSNLAKSAEINSPRGIALDSCGNLYIADNGNKRIRKVAFNPACWPEAVENTIKTTAVNIYPNPTYSTITITAPTLINNVTITNMLGQQVYAHSYSTSKAEIDVSNLPQGVYMVRVNNTYVQKLVKE